jgi:hypothetical protein
MSLSNQMNKHRHPEYLYKFNAHSLLLFTITIVISIFFNSILATYSNEVESFSENLISLKFPSSPGSTLKNPETTAGGATRAPEYRQCFPLKEQLPLTSLMPNTKNYSQTISSQPSLFVYLPKTNANSITFSLQKEIRQNKEDIITQEISLNKTSLDKINSSGIILKIPLPLDIELEKNQIYHWKISINCYESGLFANKTAEEEGIIEVVSLKPEIEFQLTNTNDTLGKARIYAREGIWLDTLTHVASIRDSRPEEWRELLESVGLEDFSAQPLIEVTSSEN